jgi:hypothetical protein
MEHIFKGLFPQSPPFNFLISKNGTFVNQKTHSGVMRHWSGGNAFGQQRTKYSNIVSTSTEADQENF